MADDNDNGERGPRGSDVPGDLSRERELFVRSFFKKGVELTETLLEENGVLRKELESLQSDNARLRAQIASDDAIRDLLKTIEKLEAEQQALIASRSELEQETQRDEGRYHEVESQLNDLANLYIASFQLHASLSLRRTVRHLQDMIGQLVGAGEYIFYIMDEGESKAFPLTWDGVSQEDLTAIELSDGPIADACVAGIEHIVDDPSAPTDGPLAVIPVVVQNRAVGAIVVLGLLEQKTGWDSVDHEIFKLLGAHAGHALAAANLFLQAPSPLQTVKGLRTNLERPSVSFMPPATRGSAQGD